MFPANDANDVAENLLDILVDEIGSDQSPSALMAVFKNPDGSKWYRIDIKEFDPTKRPPGTPVRLLP